MTAGAAFILALGALFMFWEWKNLRQSYPREKYDQKSRTRFLEQWNGDLSVLTKDNPNEQ